MKFAKTGIDLNGLGDCVFALALYLFGMQIGEFSAGNVF